MKQTVFAMITVASLFLGGDLMFPNNPRQRIKRRFPLSLRLVKKS